jgi:hypothetical protein
VALPVVAQLGTDSRIAVSLTAPAIVLANGDVYQIENQNTSEEDSSAWNVLDHQMWVRAFRTFVSKKIFRMKQECVMSNA